MRILLIYVLATHILSCWSSSCSDQNNAAVINAGAYERKFDEVFYEYWQQNRTITDELRNVAKILKQSHLKLEDLPDCPSPKKCLICRAFSFSTLTYYQSHSHQNLDEYLYDLCTVFVEISDYECRGMINIYLPTIKYILNHRANVLSSDQICGTLFPYNECSTNKNWIDFHIESNREPKLKVPKTYQFDEKALNSSSFFTIAHLSDFHYDPHYAVGSSSDCTDFVCCRNTSIPKVNSTHKAGYWGDYNSCDSPGHLIENICSHVATNHKNIDLVYYTGDFSDHFGWLTTKSSIKHSIEFITQHIKSNFPSVPVVMVIGNHDIHPSDAFAPDSADIEVNSNWLYEIVADLWSDWLPNEALSTLRHGGYYSFVFRSGLRIIVLNNNICFTHNIWLLYDGKDMVDQLEWLRDTLIAAELNGERVHILGHIPPNTSSCVRAWNREYDNLVRQFAHIISGQFVGHTHTDEFSILYSTDDVPVALNVAWNGGSGTSFIGLNSNYRLYTAELNSFEIIDHETFIFNLTEANLVHDQPPKWFKEYSFRDAFDVADLSPFTLSKLVNITMRHDRNALNKLWRFKHKLADPKMQEGCDHDCLEKTRLVTNGNIENNFFQ